MIVYMIDDTGKFLKEMVLPGLVEEKDLPHDYISIPVPEGFKDPYWDFALKEWYDKAEIIEEQAEELKKHLEELETQLRRLSTGV